MGRKVIIPQRRNELLDAYEICIAKYGFQESTLERVGQLAGIKRPAIRHFIGNRDDMRKALVQRYIEDAEKLTSELDSVFENLNPATSSISSLITKAITTRPNQLLALSHLFALSAEDSEIRTLILKWFKTYLTWLSKTLTSYYSSDKQTVTNTAHGILGICISMGALSYASTGSMNNAMTGAISQLLSSLTPSK